MPATGRGGGHELIHLVAVPHDEPQNGRVAEDEDADGQEEAEEEEDDVEETIGECPRRVVPRAGNEEAFGHVRRPAPEPRRGADHETVHPNAHANLHRTYVYMEGHGRTDGIIRLRHIEKKKK